MATRSLTRELALLVLGQVPEQKSASVADLALDSILDQALDTLTSMGYSIRTPEYRYTEWFLFNDTNLLAEMGNTIARELYDHRAVRQTVALLSTEKNRLPPPACTLN